MRIPFDGFFRNENRGEHSSRSCCRRLNSPHTVTRDSDNYRQDRQRKDREEAKRKFHCESEHGKPFCQKRIQRIGVGHQFPVRKRGRRKRGNLIRNRGVIPFFTEELAQSEIPERIGDDECRRQNQDRQPGRDHFFFMNRHPEFTAPVVP